MPRIHRCPDCGEAGVVLKVPRPVSQEVQVDGGKVHEIPETGFGTGARLYIHPDAAVLRRGVDA